MIIEEIKNSIRNALYMKDNDLIFHFEENKKTGFPYVVFSVKDFSVEHYQANNKQKFCFSFELVYAKKEDNKIIDLINAQTMISQALLPTVNILGKEITLDKVKFYVSEKQLVMNFDINIYTYENDEDELEKMQILDLTMKEDKNA